MSKTSVYTVCSACPQFPTHASPNKIGTGAKEYIHDPNFAGPISGGVVEVFCSIVDFHVRLAQIFRYVISLLQHLSPRVASYQYTGTNSRELQGLINTGVALPLGAFPCIWSQAGDKLDFSCISRRILFDQLYPKRDPPYASVVGLQDAGRKPHQGLEGWNGRRWEGVSSTRLWIKTQREVIHQGHSEVAH